MNLSLGEKIKDLRKRLDVSQAGLANGVCSQSELSRIERDQHQPSYMTLKGIADKLGVYITYFLSDSDSEREDYLNEVWSQLEKARRNRDYETIEDIVKTEMKNPLFKSQPEHRSLMWHRSMAEYYLHNDFDAAVNTLKDCLTLSSFDRFSAEINIQILNSLGIMYRDEGLLNESKDYHEQAYDLINQFTNLKDKRITAKVRYNLAKVYSDLHEVNKSLEVCYQGLSYCREYEDLFTFAEFHYQIGRNLLMQGKTEKGIDYWKKAKFLFELEGKDNLSKIIEHDIQTFQEHESV
ncbi:transcriptional regulator with XRE-family HTH domain [Alkalibacillus filiformis]|uniref:Transcriptional regulator with XRE-family HTH domain n=1 Tax=Alkalibacillus filiformis TaxID=200990 RepID=A0ABU0DTT0_9BACI|nr:helix-turn-helix domain-containing protein [Alkalibacillus filiformis]MDQ0351869.1 transcriptional regulator with XRE-family HTH domain [Alkalibacillus filiformis]